jgi:thiamine biosynthesis lipoprotein
VLNRAIHRLSLASLIAHLLTGFGCHRPLEKFQFVRPEMGTVFQVTLYAPDSIAAKKAADSAFERAHELNGILSDYDPESELSRLSRQSDNGPMAAPVAVGPDLWFILQRAVEASRQSNGAFDITIGPCVKLWRRSHQMGELPSPARLATARASVGWQAIHLFPESHAVQLLKTKMRLDVGGIAKGYAANEMVKRLRSLGFARSMAGAAGDIAVGDAPPGQANWRIAVQSLANPHQSAGYVNLHNASISTSGDTERFIIIDGQRYSHIIDPRTGLGLTHRIGATVICTDGVNADWLSKPLCILGPEQGMSIIESTPGAAARVVTIEGDETKVYESKRWREFESSGAGRSEN